MHPLVLGEAVHVYVCVCESDWISVCVDLSSPPLDLFLWLGRVVQGQCAANLIIPPPEGAELALKTEPLICDGRKHQLYLQLLSLCFQQIHFFLDQSYFKSAKADRVGGCMVGWVGGGRLVLLLYLTP